MEKEYNASPEQLISDYKGLKDHFNTDKDQVKQPATPKFKEFAEMINKNLDTVSLITMELENKLRDLTFIPITENEKGSLIDNRATVETRVYCFTDSLKELTQKTRILMERLQKIDKVLGKIV